MQDTWYKTYWNKRKDLNYYKKVFELVPQQGTLLDVGTGPTAYLNDLSGYNKIVAFDKNEAAEILDKRIETVQGDFLSPPKELGKYDTVTCLQCVEHIANKNKPKFIENLFNHANYYVVISLPYKWEKSKTKGHVGIDEEKILQWVGRQPDKSAIVQEESGAKIIINVYSVKG